MLIGQPVPLYFVRLAAVCTPANGPSASAAALDASRTASAMPEPYAMLA